MKTSIKYFLLFFTILISAVQLSAQMGVYNALIIPKELTEHANEVVRMDYMNFVIDSPKSATLHVKYVVTLLNDQSDAAEQYVRYDQHSKVTNLSAKIYDAMGKEVRKIKRKEFVDRSAISNGTIYNDSRIKTIEMYHSSYPYTIELEYSKSFKKFAFYPSSYMQSYEKSVEYYEFIVEVPDDQEIRYVARNIKLEPSIEKKDKKTIYTWKTKSLPALEYEPLAPYSEKIQPAILISPTEFQYDDYKGDMSTWETFGKFMYDLNSGQDKLSPQMAQLVNDLIEDTQSDKEKIEILYRYLQDNMRYVSVQLGIGGWQAFDAEYVEDNKYGDCKALSNFMKSMLNEVGIDSYWALIYRSNYNKLEMNPGLVSPSVANHMIINIPSENMWLECTSNDYPPNYLGGDNENRTALLITEEGGKILRTPKIPLDQNKKSTSATININSEGAAVIKKQSIYTGSRHDYYRYISNNFSKEEIEKEFLEDTELPAFTIDKLEISNDEKMPRCVVDYHISVARYSSKAGRRLFVPLNKLNPFENVPKLIKKRIHPVHVKNQYKEEDAYTFTIPVDYEVESIPNKVVSLESEFGKYQLNIEVKENIITYTRLLEIYAVELPAERYNELRDFYKEIAKADGMKAVLVKRRP